MTFSFLYSALTTLLGAVRGAEPVFTGGSWRNVFLLPTAVPGFFTLTVFGLQMQCINLLVIFLSFSFLIWDLNRGPNLNMVKLSFFPGWCSSVVECWPVNQKVAGSIPSLEHMPGLHARSPVGVCERQPCINVSLPLFLPHFPLWKINK